MIRIFTTFFLGVLLSVPSMALIVEFDPATQPGQNGDVVTFDLVASDLNGTLIGGFDIDVNFDESRLSLLGGTLGSALGEVFFGEAIDVGFGNIGAGAENIALVSLLEADLASCLFCVAPYLEDLQAGASSLILASLDFLVTDLAAGTSTSVLAQVNELVDGSGGILSLDQVGLGVVSNPDQPPMSVPEPTSVGLLLLGLGLLSTRTQRRRCS